MFPLADQRRTGEDNGQHGDIVDDRHHRAKALLLKVRLKRILTASSTGSTLLSR